MSTEIQNVFVTRQLLRQAMPTASDRIIIAFEQLFINNNLQIDVSPPTPSDGATAISMVGGLSTQIADIQAELGYVGDTANNALAVASNITQEEFQQTADPYAVSAMAAEASFKFIPAITGSALSGVGTYLKQYGIAQKIDGRVYFSIEITWTAHTGTGDLLITTGLQSPINRTAVTIVASNLTYPAGQLTAIIENNSIVSVYVQNTAALLAAVPIDTSAAIYLTGFYEV